MNAGAYWQDVPSRALVRKDRDLPTWTVPVEMALACSRSRFVEVIMKRIAKGKMPDPSAQVVVDGAQFVALVTYGGDRTIYLPLKLWTWRV